MFGVFCKHCGGSLILLYRENSSVSTSHQTQETVLFKQSILKRALSIAGVMDVIATIQQRF